MNEGIESVGSIVTGGLIARSIEHGAGEGSGDGGQCLNCGSTLIGDYCHDCGQVGHVHRSLAAFWHDLAHGVLHFEGKIWRTLPMLVWRPGELTRRYVDGERARFVSPMALFLFSVFLMFAVISISGGPVNIGNSDDFTLQNGDGDAAKERADLVARRTTLETARKTAIASGGPTGKIDEDLSETRAGIAILNMAQGKASGIDGGALAANKSATQNRLEAAYRRARANPSLLIYKMQTNAYKFSWALIPISVPFVWLLFLWRRQYRLYDHTIFVTYSLAFMTLLPVAASLMRVAGLNEAWGILAMTCLPPFHMYRQLRGAYRLSRFSALWRTVFLALFASVAVGLFFAGLLALGALG